MIGDEYLQARAQLGTALFSLFTLARELKTGPDILQKLNDLGSELEEPFLFAVIGEAKSGKSSLINALFGREICPPDSRTATDKIRVFKYGPEDKDEEVTDRITDCHRPNPILSDFNIVDTPGTDGLAPEHQTIVKQLWPVADLVIFVFSVTNPWAAPAWLLLKQIPGEQFKNTLFVLQQCDLRDEVEVDAVARHLEQNIHEKLSRECRVFAVSAREAWLAKTTATDREGLLRRSNLGALEAYIHDTVTNGEASLGKLRRIRRALQLILRDLGGQARSAFYIVRKDIEKLVELNLALGELKEQSMRQTGGVLWTLVQSYERAQKHGEELLRQRLSFAKTIRFLLKKSTSGRKSLPSIDAPLRDSIRRQIQDAVELLGAGLKGAWKQLHDSLHKRFDAGIQTAHPPDVINERNELLRQIEATLVKKMAKQQIEQQMRRLFNETATWLGAPLGTSSAEGLAKVVEALASAVSGDFAGVLAEAEMASQAPLAFAKRKKILGRFCVEMAHLREKLLSAVERHLYRGIDAFYGELAGSIHPLQDFGAAQRNIYEPMIARIRQLEESLDKMGADAGVAHGTSVKS